MRPEIRRLTTDQFLSLLASVRPGLGRKITAVHLHHTWRPNRSQFRGVASVQAMRDYHIGLGWDDIAQHLTIDPFGISWTGRNWNLPPASQKGRNGKPDAGPFMIEMVGDFDTGQDILDGEQRAAVCAVVAGILDQCGLGTKDVHFHRELGSPKTCPGTGVDKKQLVTEIDKALASLRAAPASGARATGGVAPAARRKRALPHRCRCRSSISSAAMLRSQWTSPLPATTIGKFLKTVRRLGPSLPKRPPAPVLSLETIWLLSSAGTRTNGWFCVRTSST